MVVSPVSPVTRRAKYAMTTREMSVIRRMVARTVEGCAFGRIGRWGRIRRLTLVQGKEGSGGGGGGGGGGGVEVVVKVCNHSSYVKPGRSKNP